MKPREEWHLATTHIGRRVLVFDRLDSTNTFALGLADDPANDGLVVLADEQTAGRGQHGRTWTCPGGGGVLMSSLVFPPAALRRPVILTAWAAVSVCEQIQHATGLEATIKWPNDVLIRGRKVCGILIEQTRGAVVGIGLNVNQPAEHFVANDLLQGASLAMFAQRQFDCREIARQLIEMLDVEFARLVQGDVAALEDKWTRRLELLGNVVEIEAAPHSLIGRLRALSFGGLTLELPDQSLRSMMPEAVKHVTVVGKPSRRPL
jgi:BirA family transcriptional regulator, biotin operon repressor / biotin---[acetyl-CoA-carboxylase] ligase